MHRIFITVLLLVIFSTATNAQQQADEFTTYQRVEIDITQSYDPFVMHLLGVEIDHAYKTETSIIAELSLFDIRRLQENGFQVDVLIENVTEFYAQRAAADETPMLQMLDGAPENFELGSMGGFLKYEEIKEQIDKMHDLYPNLISQRIDIGESYENRPIWKVVAGSAQSAGKPQALYTSLIHAREAASVTTIIYYLWWLLENYGVDDQATYLLDNREMVFVPVANPDGYVFNQTTNPDGGGMHRGNRRYNESNATYGVDLNRNFGPQLAWDSPLGGSSTVPGSATYRGTEPFSEPETQALRNLAERNDFKTAFNYHTFSNLLIYPFGFNQSRTPDSLLYDIYGRNMTVDNNYFVGLDQEAVGYNTRGNSDDYMYLKDEHKGKVFAFTPEVGTRQDFFWPQPSRIVPLAQENLLANKLLAFYAGAHFEIQNDQYAGNRIFSGGTNLVPLPIKDVMNIGQSELKKGLITISVNSETVHVEPSEISIGNLETLQKAEFSDIILLMTIDDELPHNKEIIVTIDVTSENSLPKQFESKMYILNSAPSSALLSFPRLDEAIDEPHLTLEWRPTDLVEHFNLEVAMDEKFSDVILSEQKLKSFSYELSNLTDHRKYYWRVQAVNPYSDGVWSDTRSFYVNTKVHTGAPNELPESLSLKGNYPNPFNPTTQIRVGLAEDGPLRVDVYTTDGRFVQTITNDNRVKGWHDITFDAANLSSGMYIYRIQTHNDVQVGKMLLVK